MSNDTLMTITEKIVKKWEKIPNLSKRGKMLLDSFKELVRKEKSEERIK